MSLLKKNRVQDPIKPVFAAVGGILAFNFLWLALCLGGALWVGFYVGDQIVNHHAIQRTVTFLKSELK